jgi:pyruvate/2-oxoglutarate dehydrogenase complex dihydrolipoamide acyltransferase (E2) component
VLGRLVKLPFRLTVDLLKLPVEGGKLALSLVRELVEREPAAPPPPPAPPREEPRPAAPPPEPAVFEPEPPEPPHIPEEEPELVAESADVDAADGGTAEVHVAEPWDGYRQLKADDVIARISVATAEELAVIELYERTHRGRKSVLAAVEKQLKALADRA